MASPAFQSMYAQAMQSDHAVLSQAMDLWTDRLIPTFPAAARGSKLLLEYYEAFIDKLEAVAAQHEMLIRSPLRGAVCPHCGSTECADASDDAYAMPDHMEELKPPMDPPSYF